MLTQTKPIIVKQSVFINNEYFVTHNFNNFIQEFKNSKIKNIHFSSLPIFTAEEKEILRKSINLANISQIHFNGYLSLNEIDLILEAINNNQSVKSLNFFNNEFSEFNHENDIIQNICKVIETNKNLKELNIINCRISPGNLKQICESLKNSNVKILSLKNNNISDLTSVLNLLESNSTLKSLSLSYNSIGDNIKQLGDLLETTHNLKSLDISYCKIDNEAFKYFLDKIKLNNSIITLFIGNNEWNKKIITEIYHTIKKNPYLYFIIDLIDLLPNKDPKEIFFYKLQSKYEHINFLAAIVKKFSILEILDQYNEIEKMFLEFKKENKTFINDIFKKAYKNNIINNKKLLNIIISQVYHNIDDILYVLNYSKKIQHKLEEYKNFFELHFICKTENIFFEKLPDELGLEVLGNISKAYRKKFTRPTFNKAELEK